MVSYTIRRVEALTGQFIKSSVENLDGVKITNNLSSGLISGGELTINGLDNTKFDISDGSGLIVDNFTDVSNPTITEVSWSNLTAQTVTNLASQNLTFVLINSSGAIVQQATYPSDEQFRDYIFIGQLGHTNRVNIGATVKTPDVLASPLNQLMDLEAAIGIINSGNVVSPNGANLKIDKSVGTLFALGSNFFHNNKDPNKVNIAAVVEATFRLRTQTGNGGTGVTDLDTGNYDNAGTITSLLNNKYTNFRVFLGINSNIVIQYGQVVYNSLNAAISGIEQESFTIYSNLENNFSLIGIISVKSDATDLTDTSDAFFSRTSKFGEVTGGTSGISTTSLQAAYNNSIEPEILTNSTRGAFSLKRGSAADTDSVFEVLNGSDNINFSLNANGELTSSNRIKAGVNEEALSANKVLVATDVQTQILDPNGSDRDVTLYATPDEGDYHVIVNDGTANVLTVKDNGGTTITTVAINVSVAVVYTGTKWVLV